MWELLFLSQLGVVELDMVEEEEARPEPVQNLRGAKSKGGASVEDINQSF